MSGIVVGDELFTIEQIELLRRLRNSGITKEQVLQAFESFDRLDQELGTLYTVPVSISSQYQRNIREVAESARNSVTSKSNNREEVGQSSLRLSHAINGHQKKYTHEVFSGSVKEDSTDHTPLNNDTQRLYSSCVKNEIPFKQRVNSDETVSRGIKRTVIDLADENDIDAESPNEHPCTSNEHSESNDSHIGVTNGARKEDVEQFFKSGKNNMIREVRKFIECRNLRPSQLAVLTGLSHNSINTFLRSPLENIEDSVVLGLAYWYTTNKTMVSELLDSPSTQGPSSQMSQRPYFENVLFDDQGEMFIPKQRDRFKFTAQHLQILESSFNQNSYPKHQERIFIAKACNLAASMDGEIMLTDKQKVTPHMVQNWFSNRRKELKKLAREEGVPETEVVLQSRLKLVKRGSMDGISLTTNRSDLTNQGTSPGANSGSDLGGDNVDIHCESIIEEDDNLMFIKNEPL